MAPNVLDLATTLENLGARWLLEKKVNFVPCRIFKYESFVYTHKPLGEYIYPKNTSDSYLDIPLYNNLML